MAKDYGFGAGEAANDRMSSDKSRKDEQEACAWGNREIVAVQALDWMAALRKYGALKRET